MAERSPITQVDIRKVTNGYVVRYSRLNADPAQSLHTEEKFFVSWKALQMFLTIEGFVL